MADRIQTHKILNNRYFNGEGGDLEGFGNSQIQVSPYMSKQYDYALTDDIVLLNDRKDTEQKIYNIFISIIIIIIIIYCNCIFYSIIWTCCA